MTTSTPRVTEAWLIDKIARYLAQLGDFVFTNARVFETEIDIVSVNITDKRVIVKIVEVKSQPKKTLIQQVHNRACYAHRVYAGLPAWYLDWALRELPKWCGIITVDRDGKVVIRRRAQWVNRDRIAPIALAQMLFDCGLKIAKKVYLPGGKEITSGGEVSRLVERLQAHLTRLMRAFFSSSSTSSSSPESSESSSSPDLSSDLLHTCRLCFLKLPSSPPVRVHIYILSSKIFSVVRDEEENVVEIFARSLAETMKTRSYSTAQVLTV